MNYEGIKTHSERCESHPDHQWGMITNQTITNLLLDEIAQLRDYIEAQIKYPVYTTQSKRKPLTDGEILKVYDGMLNQIVDQNYRQRLTVLFARAIERAHGIGGEECRTKHPGMLSSCQCKK